MNKNVIALAVAAGLAMPGLANAVEVAGNALDVYGQVHASIDSAKTYDATSSSVSKLSMSSNSSRLGFKGKGELSPGLTGFYKLEAAVSVTNGDSSNFLHRASIVGLKGNFGSLALGYQDTIYKDTFKKFDVMFNSIGDSRNILGAGEGFDTRAKNGIYYRSPKMGAITLGVGYSTAYEDKSVVEGTGQNNNNNSLVDAVLAYSANGLTLAAGYAQHKTNINATTGDSDQTITGNRLVGSYKTGPMDIRAIYEHMSNSGVAATPDFNRNTYGLAFVYKVGGPGSVILQYMKAGESDASNDGANQVTVGYSYKLAKNSKTYIMYDKISNDANANFGIGAGHDLKYTNGVSGQDVSAISVGYVYKF